MFSIANRQIIFEESISSFFYSALSVCVHPFCLFFLANVDLFLFDISFYDSFAYFLFELYEKERLKI